LSGHDASVMILIESSGV